MDYTKLEEMIGYQEARSSETGTRGVLNTPFGKAVGIWNGAQLNKKVTKIPKKNVEADKKTFRQNSNVYSLDSLKLAGKMLKGGDI